MYFFPLPHKIEDIENCYKNLESIFSEIIVLRDNNPNNKGKDNSSQEGSRIFHRATERIFTLMIEQLIELQEIYQDALSENNDLGLLVGINVAKDIDKVVSQRNSIVHEYSEPIEGVFDDLIIWQKRIKAIQKKLQHRTVCPNCGYVMNFEKTFKGIIEVGTFLYCEKCEKFGYTLNSFPLILNTTDYSELNQTHIFPGEENKTQFLCGLDGFGLTTSKKMIYVGFLVLNNGEVPDRFINFKSFLMQDHEGNMHKPTSLFEWLPKQDDEEELYKNRIALDEIFSLSPLEPGEIRLFTFYLLLPSELTNLSSFKVIIKD
jgi:hypothetical protein